MIVVCLKFLCYRVSFVRAMLLYFRHLKPLQKMTFHLLHLETTNPNWTSNGQFLAPRMLLKGLMTNENGKKSANRSKLADSLPKFWT
jgi:hypothetical protein